ncbi:hypothetical protein PLICRDRAFT_309836 [Plicaturopsis crispa FD-325 SS-3]|nr:hypothetical protein PLICRDRAFT_309836 [Plicaturopsis crispa FD-325 SS-3]
MGFPKFRIAICGAGIGGLAVAVTIGKFCDLPIDVYEAGADVSTIGAGITVWKRTWEVLEKLGLDKALWMKAVAPANGPTFSFRRSDQKEEGFEFYSHKLPSGAPLHRADMLHTLLENLPRTCTLHLSKRLTKYVQKSSGAITLYFADGSAVDADVLVGADGVRSPTRATLFEDLAATKGDARNADYRQYIPPKWCGLLAYRSVFPAENLKARNPGHLALTTPLMYCGKGKQVVAYPISQGHMINVVAMHYVENGAGTHFPEKWVVNVTAQDVADLYVGWEPEVVQLLQHLDRPSRWAVHVVDQLPTYASGNVALLGDAAHAMTPHCGAGAGQAIEDAYILGRFLAHPSTTLKNISAVLRAYDEIRRPFANSIVSRSRSAGHLYMFSEPGYYDGVDRAHEKEKLDAIAQAIAEAWAWQKGGGVATEWEAAETRLKEMASV